MELEDQMVRREALLPKPREHVWQALRDADGLAGWLADEVELEIRPGAEGRLRWEDGEERIAVVEEVQQGRRLVLCWRELDGEPSLVELTLDDVPGGTRLVVIELPVVTLDGLARAVEGGASAARGPQMCAVAA